MSDVESPSTVLLISGDLMFASRVRGSAGAPGLKFGFSGSLPKAPSPEVKYVVLDLSTAGGKIGPLGEQKADLFPAAKTIAFGPHVDTAKLQAARDAGFDQVLTRSQLVQLLPQLFS